MLSGLLSPLLERMKPVGTSRVGFLPVGASSRVSAALTELTGRGSSLVPAERGGGGTSGVLSTGTEPAGPGGTDDLALKEFDRMLLERGRSSSSRRGSRSVQDPDPEPYLDKLPVD